MKQAMVAFEPSSVYGSRSGFQEVVLITAADPKNVFHKTSLWKQGVVTGVSMLPRQDMVKPSRLDSLWGADSRFTKVQEMKQDWTDS